MGSFQQPKEGETMHVLVVMIDIKAEFTERFVAAMLDDARGSVKNEPGCVRFDVIQDAENPNRIYLYEVYTDKAAFDHHLTTPHFITWRDAVQDWFAAPPVVGQGPNLFPADTDWAKNWKAS
jgi:quinol monooxygenase YgiN